MTRNTQFSVAGTPLGVIIFKYSVANASKHIINKKNTKKIYSSVTIFSPSFRFHNSCFSNHEVHPNDLGEVQSSASSPSLDDDDSNGKSHIGKTSVIWR